MVVSLYDVLKVTDVSSFVEEYSSMFRSNMFFKEVVGKEKEIVCYTFSIRFAELANASEAEKKVIEDKGYEIIGGTGFKGEGFSVSDGGEIFIFAYTKDALKSKVKSLFELVKERGVDFDIGLHQAIEMINQIKNPVREVD